MQIHVSARHLKLTASINAYVAQKLSAIEHIANDIIGAHVVLIEEDSKKKNRICVKVHLAVPGPDIHVEQKDSDLFTAIDKIEDKLARGLRKRKTKLKEKARHKAQVAAEKKKRGQIA